MADGPGGVASTRTEDMPGQPSEDPAPPKGFHWLRESERRRYPDYLLPIAGQLVPDDERFVDARERLLLGYGLRTARAYRSDLDDAYAWAMRRGFPVLDLTDAQVAQYCALLRRRRYAESSIRRRLTALKGIRSMSSVV
jgi:hypothetical protein